MVLLLAATISSDSLAWQAKTWLVRGMCLQGLHKGAQYVDVCVSVGGLGGVGGESQADNKVS